MFTRVYWNQPVGPSIRVSVPVGAQNTSNFVSPTRNVLLQLCRNLTHTLIIYWCFARHNFEVLAPFRLRNYFPLNLQFCFYKSCFCQSTGECINPFPNNKILDSSKLKEFADDNFKFDENGRKFFR